MLQEHRRDRFLGGIIGLAIGDALGTPFEDRTASEIELRLADAPELDFRPDSRGRIAPGEWTDDTGLAEAVMRSLIRCRGYEGVDVAGSLAKYYRSRPKRMLPYTRNVLRAIDADPENWQEKAREIWIEEGSAHAGNGALVPCLLAGFFHSGNIDRMIKTTVRLCHITYYDPRCVESALALNFLLMQSLQGRASDRTVEQAVAFLAAIRSDKRLSDMIYDLEATSSPPRRVDSLYLPYIRERDAVDRSLARLAARKTHNLQNTRYCVSSMEVAISCLLNTDSFASCVEAAVRLGGNADTQGALAGALAGARYGMTAIPRPWLARVKDSARLLTDAETLLSTADRALEKEFESGELRPAGPVPPVL